MSETFDPRRVEQADVFKEDRRAGSLVRERTQIVFRYDDEYRQAEGEAVAFTLPLTDEPTVASGGAVPSFFAGLLPEGVRLDALVTRVKTSPDDMLSLLLAVGSDAVGDVSVVPQGAAPEPPAAFASPPWDESDFEHLFATSIGAPGERVALPGVQAKVSASVVSFPVQGGQGEHILKLNPPAYPRLVENEAFFLRAARETGFRAAQAELVYDCDGRAGLLVERFDRVHRDGAHPKRVHQEDACQVQGLYPADKYRVSARDVVDGVARNSAAPVPARLNGFRQFVFAFLIGNGDLHAKNVSIFRDPATGLFTPTPVYDVLSTLPYPAIDAAQALEVTGRTDDLTRSRFVEFGRQLGLRERALFDAIDRICDVVPSWIDRLETIGFDQRRTHKLRRTILYRRGQLGS